MKLKSPIILGFLAILVLAFMIFSLLRLRGSSKNDILIVWGQNDNQCLIWSVNPQTQQSTPPIQGLDTCEYMTATIQGIRHLIHIQSFPGEVSLYSVSENGQISIEQTISIDGLKITSHPQWDQTGFIYLSGIQGDQEQIYRINISSGETSQLTDVQNGMAYAPLLSPDGKYLAYLVYTEAANSTECFLQICGGHYYVMDIEKNTSLNLNPFVMRPEFPFDHCLATWSPNSEFLAFAVGCGSQDPREIVLFNTAQNEVAAKLGQDDAVGLPDIHGWFTTDELVYSSSTDFTLGDVGQLLFPIRRYYIYSLTEKSTYELAEFPLLISSTSGSGELFRLSNINWTEDGRHLVGITARNSKQELVIANFKDDLLQVNYTYLHNSDPLVRPWQPFRTDPAWSVSGNWVAYSSANGGIAVISKTGDMLYKLELPQMIEYEFAWLQP